MPQVQPEGILSRVIHAINPPRDQDGWDRYDPRLMDTFMRVVDQRLNAPDFPFKGRWEVSVAPQVDDFNAIYTFYARHFGIVISFDIHKYSFNHRDLNEIIHGTVEGCYRSYLQNVLDETLAFLGRQMPVMNMNEVDDRATMLELSHYPTIEIDWSP